MSDKKRYASDWLPDDYVNHYNPEMFEKALDSDNLWNQDSLIAGVFNNSEYSEFLAKDLRHRQEWIMLKKTIIFNDNKNSITDSLVYNSLLEEILFEVRDMELLSDYYIFTTKGIGWYLVYSNIYNNIDRSLIDKDLLYYISLADRLKRENGFGYSKFVDLCRMCDSTGELNKQKGRRTAEKIRADLKTLLTNITGENYEFN